MMTNLMLLATIGPMLAYRPVLDPVRLDGYGMLMFLPLVIVIAIVYKTIKLDDLDKLPRQAAILATQITAFMILAAAAIWLMVEIW